MSEISLRRAAVPRESCVLLQRRVVVKEELLTVEFQCSTLLPTVLFSYFFVADARLSLRRNHPLPPSSRSFSTHRVADNKYGLVHGYINIRTFEVPIRGRIYGMKLFVYSTSRIICLFRVTQRSRPQFSYVRSAPAHVFRK